jgi:NtrC-family two-component system sensor histidine kinase KinB
VTPAGERAFTAADVSILELMGNAAMLALRNARLFEEVQAASAAKTQFLNMAAHELRTPVTVISGFTSILQQRAFDDPADTRNALMVIEQKAEELAKLVDALLLTARTQSGVVTTTNDAFDLVHTTGAAVAAGQAFAELRRGTLTAVLPDRSVEAMGNPTHARRVIDNLINNAIAYGVGPPHVEVRLTAAEAHVDVDVHDEGRGIAPSEHERVFDEFVRLDDGEAGASPGAGLGLYIARRLARAMGGEVALVSSIPGRGSLFRLRLRRPGSDRRMP